MGEGPDESVKNYVRILMGIALNLEIAFGGVLVRVSIVRQRCHDHCKSNKGKHFTGAGLQFRWLAHYYHDWEHGSLKAGMVLEK